MALTFSSNAGNGDYKTVPAGSHIAVCNLVADLGLQPGSKSFPDPKRKIYVRFEIPAERVEYEKDGHKQVGPAVIGAFFTASMHEKATLRQRLESWRGKKFTDEQASSFDVSTILGKACLLTVVENAVGDRIYANIASIGALPKGTAAPGTELGLLYYAEEDRSSFDKLPEWLRKKIESQLQPKPRAPRSPDAFEITDDDIPF